jgi:hypothetical protein
VVLLAFVASAVLTACAGAETVPLRVGGATFQVEIADTPEERRRGLMHRDELPEGRGMLFVFEDEDYRSFWMKNTTIPLSIAYISSDGVIMGIHDMEPQSMESVQSQFRVQYALEVNRGAFEERGITVGSEVILPDRVTAE